MTLTCLPRGLCSWSYRISGGGVDAETELRVWEAGTLRVNGQEFMIEREGTFSGDWKLRHRDQGELSRARKCSAFSRRFELSGTGGILELAPRSLGRTMILSGPGSDVVYEPVHPFTRRATIRGQWQDDVLVVFGFWLTVVTWKRAAAAAASNNG